MLLWCCPAGHTEVRRHRRLVISFIATIANYVSFLRLRNERGSCAVCCIRATAAPITASADPAACIPTQPKPPNQPHPPSHPPCDTTCRSMVRVCT